MPPSNEKPRGPHDEIAPDTRPQANALSSSRKVSRRALVGGGAFALVAGGALYTLTRGSGEPGPNGSAGNSKVFPKDAPRGQLWADWQARGWVREASHYLTQGPKVRCQLCPNECVLEPEDRSRCRNKVNKEGKLYTLAYGNPCSFHVDPIEKKPLYHFLPGTRAFSIATSGCNFRCLNCQNWEISQKTPEQLKDASGPELRATRDVLARLRRDDSARLSMFPEDVVDLAEVTGSQVIAYTYSEPIAFYEYMLRTAQLARARGIKNVWVSNGYIKSRPLKELAQFLDGANINLKSFSNETHKKLNQGTLAPVLDTLKALHGRGVWFEVTNLVVPTYTDDLSMIARMSEWIARHLGEEQPLHFSRFHPQYRLDHLSPTPIDVLLRARETAHAAGLKHVYIGNARRVADAEITRCASCRRVVVERTAYRVETLRIDGGRCAFCRARVAGVWHTA